MIVWVRSARVPIRFVFSFGGQKNSTIILLSEIGFQCMDVKKSELSLSEPLEEKFAISFFFKSVGQASMQRM